MSLTLPKEINHLRSICEFKCIKAPKELLFVSRCLMSLDFWQSVKLEAGSVTTSADGICHSFL